MSTLAYPRQDVFAAIADPTRREILAILKSGQKTVGELASKFVTSRPAISKHLRVLENAGLVKTTTVGRNSICVIDPEPLHQVSEWVMDYEQLWKHSLASLKQFVEEAGE